MYEKLNPYDTYECTITFIIAKVLVPTRTTISVYISLLLSNPDVPSMKHIIIIKALSIILIPIHIEV